MTPDEIVINVEIELQVNTSTNSLRPRIPALPKLLWIYQIHPSIIKQKSNTTKVGRIKIIRGIPTNNRSYISSVRPEAFPNGREFLSNSAHRIVDAGKLDARRAESAELEKFPINRANASWSKDGEADGNLSQLFARVHDGISYRYFKKLGLSGDLDEGRKREGRKKGGERKREIIKRKETFLVPSFF